MTRRTTAVAIGLTAVLFLGASGCGGSDAATTTTTKPAKQGSGGDVDINSKDGTVKYTDKNGNETEMNIDGEGASLPDGWPSDLAPPDSVTLLTANTSSSGGHQVLTVLGEAPGTVDELYTALKGQVADAGFRVTQETGSGVTDGTYAGLSAAKGDQTLVVGITTAPTSKGKVTISMTVKSKA